MPAIVADHPDWRFILLTVTVESVPMLHLRDALTHLHASVDRMVKRAAFAPVGWVRNTEVTINYATGMAHPHAHLLCAVPSSYFDAPLRKVKGATGRPRVMPGYMTQAQWALLWKECARLEYWPVLDVRAVKGDVTTAEGRRALYEITKYGTKPGDLVRLEPDDFRRLHLQLKSTRSIGIGGALSAYLKEIPDESDEPEVFPDVVIAARWNEKEKRYLTDFGVHLDRAQEDRALLNARMLPEAKLLARKALKNRVRASDYADAEAIRHQRNDGG